MSPARWALGALLALAPVAETAGGAAESSGEPLPPGAVQRLGDLRLRYPRCGGLAYLPDGRAVVLQGGCVDIWDMAKGERQSRTELSASSLRSVQVRSDGKVLLLGDSAGTVREWSVDRRAEVRSWDTGHRALRSACYSPDETRVLTAGNSPPGLKEWDLATGKMRVEIRSQMLTTRCGAIYGPGGRTALMGGGYDHNLEHYDLATGKLLKKWCSIYEAKQLALSPDQRYVTVGVEDRALEWSLEDYKVLHHYKHCPGEAARIFAVAYIVPANEVLCGGRDGSLHRWSRQTGRRVLSWRPHQSAVTRLCVSPDNQWALSFGTGQVAETRIATGEPRHKWDRHHGSVEAAAFLPSGQQLVSASSDATLRIWDLASGRTLRVIRGARLGAYALAISPDGKRAAAGCKDGVIRLFSLADGTLLRELAGHRGYIRSLAYTHDGSRLLSSADDGSICVWQDASGGPVARLEGHRGGVLALAVSPDDGLALSGGRDGTVRLWDIARRQLLRTCEGHRGWVRAAAFAAGGRYAISAGDDRRVLRWDAATGKLDAELARRGWRSHALACSPDGLRLYAAGDGRGATCWDVLSAETIADLKGHRHPASALAVSPDGKFLVTGSRDTTLLVWRAPR